MLTSPGELAAIRRRLQAAVGRLAAQGLPHASDLPLGVMIEVPSAVSMADVLAREVESSVHSHYSFADGILSDPPAGREQEAGGGRGEW